MESHEVFSYPIDNVSIDRTLSNQIQVDTLLPM